MDDEQRSQLLTQLVQEYHAFLYRYACRLTGSSADAEDLTQQTYLIAQRKLEQLRDPENAKAWLCTIVRNQYFKAIRKTSTKGTPVSLDSVPEPTEFDPEASVDSEELQGILKELPEDFRTPLVLFYFEECSYKEIAEQLQIPLGTVMSRLARAKTYLKRRLNSSQPAGS